MASRRSTPAKRVPRVLLLIESSRSSGRSLLRGIASYARDHGPWAFYWQPGGLKESQPDMQQVDADGIILRDVGSTALHLKHGLPAIVVGHSRKRLPGLTNVLTDSEAVASLAADHLLTCGYRQFGYCGLAGVPWSDARGHTFQRILKHQGFTVHTYSAPSPSGSKHCNQERTILARWLKSLPKPLGLMTCNDDRGEQAIEACKVAGLRVPDDIGIIGVDNDELVCDLSDPPLSSVALNFESAGYQSAALLDRMMRGQSCSDEIILVRATRVAARRSTDIVAIDDLHVFRALRFIRDHAREPLAVPDVARAAGLSRRVLEKRFQKHLRRSVLAEIRRVRVDHICRLLIETTQPVSQIAHTLGFAGAEHIARYFRREKRLTPLEFRHTHSRS